MQFAPTSHQIPVDNLAARRQSAAPICHRRLSGSEAIDVPISIPRRRYFSVEQKLKILQQACMPGMTVSHVARLHEISPSLIFHWRQVLANGASCKRLGEGHDAHVDADHGSDKTTGTVDDPNACGECRVLVARVHELESKLRKVAHDNEKLREAVRIALDGRFESEHVAVSKPGA